MMMGLEISLPSQGEPKLTPGQNGPEMRYAGRIYCEAACPECAGTCNIPTGDDESNPHPGRSHCCNYPAHHTW
jgi:hypothetical protein